jgi:hypothetical protein
LAALAAIQPATRQHVLPLLEIMPGPGDEPAAVRQVIQRTAMKLQTWTGRRLLLDVGNLPTDVELRDGLGAVGTAATEAISRDIRATPVLRLNDQDIARRDAAAVHREHGGGIAVRLSAEDLDDEAENLEQALTDLLGNLGARRPDVDIVIDLGAIHGDLGVRAGARLVVDVLRDQPGIDEWRQIIVTAGAFPADLSAFEPWTIGESPRYDASMYDHLQQRRRLTRIPTFGDYAVGHPLLVTGRAFPTYPQLAYTVADRWLTLRGRHNDPRGHQQFFLACDVIARHPEFVGTALGRGDTRIANSRSYPPGNASTWREIETTHHLDYVVQRLTTLGEP